MFYKLSNTIDLLKIESAFDAHFKYPSLYETNPIINGLYEQSLPVITKENPDQINYAIWGMVPQNYKDGWDSFQKLSNTLNIPLSKVNTLGWVHSLLNQQRCVIIVSGFFTSYVFNGEVYPYYVYSIDHKPFALAGVYSILNDGFLSVSLISSTKQNELKHIHNLGEDFPIALSSEDFEDWFNLDINLPNCGIENLKPVELNAHTISKEFYKNDIIYDAVLEPANYYSLPIHSLK
ncbi:SOS response-associated peptidase family protein [Winogradskyella vidalii]|uniref:SOS response-associated peptidase family protein n=1 Tax=Winogradskyella vidalii TaxID=2615024 RepID=UPI0015C98DB7|nr:SOS response-associated peptidase family protein [Winogradskyella vidalii]